MIKQEPRPSLSRVWWGDHSRPGFRARRYREIVGGVGVTCCKEHSQHVRAVLPRDRRRAEPAAPRDGVGRRDRAHRGAVAERRLHRDIELGDDALRELPPPRSAVVGRVDVPDRAVREHAPVITRSWTAISGARATSTSRCSSSRVMRRPSWNAMRNMAAVGRVTVNRNAPTNSSAVYIGPSLVGETNCSGRASPMARGRSGPDRWSLALQAGAPSSPATC